jgi:hypothetical protein
LRNTCWIHADRLFHGVTVLHVCFRCCCRIGVSQEMIPKREPDSTPEGPAVESDCHYCVTCLKDCETRDNYFQHMYSFSHIKRVTEVANDESFDVASPCSSGQSGDDPHPESPPQATFAPMRLDTEAEANPDNPPPESTKTGDLSCDICCVDFKTTIMQKYHMLSGEHIERLNATSTPLLAGLGNVYALGRPTDTQATVSPGSLLGEEPAVTADSKADDFEPVIVKPPAAAAVALHPAAVLSESCAIVKSNHSVKRIQRAQRIESISYDCDLCQKEYTNSHDYILHISRNTHILRYIVRESARRPGVNGTTADSIPELNGEKQQGKRAPSTAPNAEPANKKRITSISFP